MTNSRVERIIHWRKVFSEHEASGLNVAIFCQRAHISKYQYYYWKQRVNNNPVAVQNESESTFEARDFIQVSTFDLVRKHGHETTGSKAVEIRIGSISLLFRSDTDRELFKTAVSVIIEVAG